MDHFLSQMKLCVSLNHETNYDFNSIEYQVITLLKKIGCCLICSLRLSGFNFVEQNIDPNIFFSKVELTFDSASLPNSDPCIVCLGILQKQILTSVTDRIVNQLQDLNSDCITVSLGLTIPAAVQIRERVLYTYLSKNFTIPYTSKVKVQSIKSIWRWYMSPEIERVTCKRVETSSATSPFSIDIVISYLQDKDECIELYKYFLNISDNKLKFSTKNKRGSVTKKDIDAILNCLTDEQFEKYYTIPPKKPTMFANIDRISYKHSSIFIGGRYMKLSRRLCQTPWFVQGAHKMDSSVQEIICNYIADYTKSESIKFLSSGREDVDVRMLLNGRPFAMELINPRITKNLDANLLPLRNKVNTSSEKVKIINGLKQLTRIDLIKLKEGEHLKTKSYRALCICKNVTDVSIVLKKLNMIRNLQITQNTPIRVLHRRTLSPRLRIIHELRARLPTTLELENYLAHTKSTKGDYTLIIVDMKTQAGTYIKEFVHGDFGRTVPNLCNLLETEIDLVALDVTNIALQWP